VSSLPYPFATIRVTRAKIRTCYTTAHVFDVAIAAFTSWWDPTLTTNPRPGARFCIISITVAVIFICTRKFYHTTIVRARLGTPWATSTKRAGLYTYTFAAIRLATSAFVRASAARVVDFGAILNSLASPAHRGRTALLIQVCMVDFYTVAY
jgi:hypothetical protein